MKINKNIEIIQTVTSLPLAPGNGPIANSRGDGLMFHLGTNNGLYAWCGGEYPNWTNSIKYFYTSSGPLIEPDYWCKKCIRICRKMHGYKLKIPSPLQAVKICDYETVNCF